MSQDFVHISPAEKISQSLQKLLNRDLAALTMFSGTRDPDASSLTEDMVGIWLDRTDLKIIKRLASVTPSVVWEDLFNYGSYVPTKPEIDDSFQPLNDNLTALSEVQASTSSIPYFISSTQMSVIPVNQWGVTFIQSDSAETARETLGLGDLAIQDVVDGSQISDKSIGLEKLNFDVSSAGYDTGDLLETTGAKSFDDGWILLDGKTIGNETSNATAAASEKCEALFKMLWSNANLKIYGPDGVETTRGSAEQDWTNSRQLGLPDARGRIFQGASSQEEVCSLTDIALSNHGTQTQTLGFISLKCYIRL